MIKKTKISTTYECEYCNKSYKTLSGVNKHERICNKSPIESNHNAIETIRQSATSIHDLISKITNFLDSIGIEIIFTDYPTTWSDLVSNSHNAPRGYEQNWGSEPSKPKGYPGWTGRWKGSIKHKNSNKEVRLSDLTHSQGNPVMHIPFMHTGSGCTGQNFSIEGKLYLYDFPLMYKTWVEEGKEYEYMLQEYSPIIHKLREEYHNCQSSYITNDPLVASINTTIGEVTTLLSDLKDQQSNIIAYKKNEFVINNPLKLPSILHMATDPLVVKQLVKDSTSKDIASVKLNNYAKELLVLSEKLITYKSNNPEYFI